MKQLVAIAIGATVLTGCADTTPPPAHDPAMDQLAAAARQIQGSINVLGDVAKADHPGVRADDYGSRYPAPLMKTASIEWSGPVDLVVKKLCAEAGVDVRVTGLTPLTPVLVYVNAKDVRIGDILRDIGYQAGDRAEITVRADSSPLIVELAYATADAN